MAEEGLLESCPAPAGGFLSDNYWSVLLAELRAVEHPADAIPALVSWLAREGRIDAGEARDLLDATLPLRDGAADSRARLSHLESVFDNASEAIFISDARGRYRDANARGLEMFGYTLDELRERTLLDLLPPDDEPPHVDLLLAGERVMSERRFLRSDGSIFVGEITAKMLPDGSFLGIVRDIDERRRLEERERHLTKLEAVGQLAGGVAHDFNNLLTVISGQAELAELGLRAGHEARVPLGRVVEACARGRRLSERLLAYARRNPHDPEPASVAVVLRRVIPLIEQDLPPNVSFQTRLADDLGSCVIDTAELEFSLLNLARNAVEAMPRGGQLTLSSETRAESSEHMALKTGPCVLIEVTDTGVGIAAEVRDRVFEPFFTTKPSGRGTGLGLALVDATVSEAGGRVEIDSEEGRGTTVRLIFPRSDADASSGELDHLPPQQPRTSILVAEDDPNVLDVMVHGLRSHGFDVAGFPDPHEALDAFDADPDRWAAIVSDVRMPGLTGPQLIARLRARRDDLPAVLVSGYADPADLAAAPAVDRVLDKPFSIRQLAATVRELLPETG